MAVQTLKQGGRRFVVVPEKDFLRMQRALERLDKQYKADIRLARKRLRDPKEKPVPYEQARKELGLA